MAFQDVGFIREVWDTDPACNDSYHAGAKPGIGNITAAFTMPVRGAIMLVDVVGACRTIVRWKTLLPHTVARP